MLTFGVRFLHCEAFLFPLCILYHLEVTLHWRLREWCSTFLEAEYLWKYLKFCTGDLSLFLLLPLFHPLFLESLLTFYGTMRYLAQMPIYIFWPQFWISHFSKKSVFLLGKGIRNHCLSTKMCFCYCDIIMVQAFSGGEEIGVYTNLCIHTSTNMCFTVCICIKLNMRSYCLQH